MFVSIAILHFTTTYTHFKLYRGLYHSTIHTRFLLSILHFHFVPFSKFKGEKGNKMRKVEEKGSLFRCHFSCHVINVTRGEHRKNQIELRLHFKFPSCNRARGRMEEEMFYPSPSLFVSLKMIPRLG